MQKQNWRGGWFGGMALLMVASVALAQQANNPKSANSQQKGSSAKMSYGYDDTPFLPGDKWRVHDGKRPQPEVVTPAPASEATPAPADAVVLFDGSTTSGWRHASGDDAKWQLVDGGAMEVVKGTGDIFSKQEFGDCQLHLEFASPSAVESSGQGRGNSGLFLMGIYEIQILDNYENPTYADGTVGAIYGQYPPLVNAIRKPGEWNTYDVIWRAPRFENGQVKSPAVVTVLLNGVVVQANQTLIGTTPHRTVGTYTEHAPQGPIKLQDHGNPVRFRNIWVRPLNLEDR
ncbi:MAG: DUF1080 domain-containing protein [Armatimonadaceae bacterium]